jgi:hypothetical protein
MFAVPNDLAWFSRSKFDGGMEEREIFAKEGFCAVFVAGHNRSLRIGWTGRDPRKIGAGARVIAWCAGEPLAKRILAEVSQLLASRLVSDGYDVPVNLAEQSIRIAADKAGIRIITHEAMLQQVKTILQHRIDKLVSSA